MLLGELTKFVSVEESHMSQAISPEHYQQFVNEIRASIQKAQLDAYRKVNKSIIELYWYIGQKIVENQKKYRWGKAVVENLSMDLQRDFPGIQGFSVQNLWRMRNFFLAYSQNTRMLTLLGEIGWTHHIVLLEKLKDSLAREYYMLAVKQYGWTANVLVHKIESGDFERFAISKSHNFDQALPEKIRNQAKLAVKDHFVFDFLEMGEDHLERELEDGLIQHLPDLIMELGYGEFAFLGRQFKVTVANEEFFIDLLFYHRTLRALVALELKAVKFEPEHLGKMNFYLKALDMHVRKKDENPSIGIILCKEKNETIVEYAFSDIEKPMGVATYAVSKALPDKYQGLLPSPEEIGQKLKEYKERMEVSGTLEESSPVPLLSQPSLSKNSILNRRQTQFLQAVEPNSQITSKQYGEKMRVSLSTALRDLTELHKKGYVEKLGKRKDTSYRVLQNQS
jgi:predicted nuclease of restriction endonuclease-like (RecB) superfamily/ribosomal protein S25